MQFFSIVVPTYNRLATLIEVFLPSIEKQLFEKLELVVIDDASTDGTNNYFRSEKFHVNFPHCHSKLKYHRNEVNKGSPISRNIGFDMANGEWIFMGEDDLQISDEHFFQKAYNLILSEEIQSNVAVVCPKREEWGTKGYYKNFNGNFINYGILSKEIYCDPNKEYKGFTDNAHACSFIRTSIAKTIRYDFKSFKYFREESDFYERIRTSGFKLYYVGNILKTKHRMDLVTAGGNRKHSKQLKNFFKYIESHYKFVSKNFNFPVLRTSVFAVIRVIKQLSKIFFFSKIDNVFSFFRI